MTLLARPIGSDEFEDWCKASGVKVHQAIEHKLFPGNIRGLTLTESPEKDMVAMQIPKGIVLQSDYTDNDWDAELAAILWSELQKGSVSEVAGYCKWLQLNSENQGDALSSVAPNALRRWSDEEKALLEKEEAGKRILGIQQRQEESWKLKHKQYPNMSWEEFRWCMEVVHSRAFCGIGQDGVATSLVLSLLAPLLAAAGGFAYYSTHPLAFALSEDSTLLVLGAGLLFALLPTFLQAIMPPNVSAVLLPLIDSANHLQHADSKIDYDPLKKQFDLTIGTRCINGDQLFITYGDKRDDELLLNFGFLPGLEIKDGMDTSEQRQQLAEAYLTRMRKG